MNRAEIIETMARGVDPYAWDADTIGEPARHSCRAKAERCLSALEAAGLAVVPGHAMASGRIEESAGRALYEHFAFYPNEQKPAWTPAGNAIRQDDARRLAMAAVNAWLAAAQGAHKP